MKIVTVEFECDACHKRVVCNSGFPYNSGWHYLYDFNIQIPTEVKPQKVFDRIIVKDKHFCSKDCMFKAISDFESLRPSHSNGMIIDNDDEPDVDSSEEF